MDKNIATYCGYIGLISFVVYRTDMARLPTRTPGRRLPRRITQSGAGQASSG
jgi:hypothetical protein